MADTKTTAEAAASALGGTELVRGVQSAANVKITIDQIKTYISGALGVAAGTSLALGGATIDVHTLAVTGTVNTSSSIESVGEHRASSFKAAATGSLYWNGRTIMQCPADGRVVLFNAAGTDFSRIMYGGEDANFPAHVRNGVGLEVKLADASAFTSIKGKLTTDTAATTGLTAGALAALTNASIVVYDGGGQAYRIPCII